MTSSTMPAMVTNLRVGDLANPIHAIFRRSNFGNVSNDEYDAMATTLRLATRLLTTKEIAGFPHAILVARYGHWRGPGYHEEWWFQEKLPKLTDQDMAEYEAALSTFADMVTFTAVTSENAGCGYCNMNWHLRAPRASRLQAGSTIRFSRDDVTWTMDNRGTSSELASQKHSLITAKLLCHELMHAMVHARLGNLTNKPFDMPFGRQTVVETGYEWEDYVFGGLLAGQRPDGTPNTAPQDFENLNILHSEWPNATVTRQYVANNYPIVIWQEPPSIQVHWLIDPAKSHSWIPSLFTTHFWENEVPTKGAGAVKAPKIRGFRYWVDAQGRAYKVAKPLALPAYTIPAGYKEDALNGEMIPKTP